MKYVLIGSGLLLAVALGVALDPTRAVLGTLRGEPFYGGRPASYWRKELLDDAPGARTNAVKALADGGQGAVPVLVELLRESGPDKASAEVRWTAALALGHVGPGATAAVPALIEALDDPEPLVRLSAADALGKVGPAAGDAVPKLAEMLKTDEPVRVIKAIRKMRGVNLPAIPALVEALEHPDAEVRENAAEALGEIGPAARDAAPALEALREDPSEKVRQEGARALERITGPEANGGR
jgi:HEAT repeat protein